MARAIVSFGTDCLRAASTATARRAFIVGSGRPDFAATLVDVHPSGLATNVCEGIRRARFRESLEQPSLIEAGRVYEYRIDLWETSNLFKAGHRIRVEVTSSNFPRFDRNLNTCEDQATGTRWQTAAQTIFHDQRYPSHILLPVIPR